MTFTRDIQGDTGRVGLTGRFDFACHQAFRDATDPLLEHPGLRRLTLDLSGLEDMDPSALGMLLVLREKAEARGLEVVLQAPAPFAASVLDQAGLGKLFQIVK